MSTLLIVHHSPTPSVMSLTQAAVDGAAHPDLSAAGVVVEMAEALATTEAELLAADGVVLVTPVNFGYISGALKHVFDQHFRSLEGKSDNRPYGAILKGTTDATGAVRALEAITTGLRWRRVVQPLAIEGPVGPPALASAAELGATVAASLLT